MQQYLYHFSNLICALKKTGVNGQNVRQITFVDRWITKKWSNIFVVAGALFGLGYLLSFLGNISKSTGRFAVHFPYQACKNLVAIQAIQMGPEKPKF